MTYGSSACDEDAQQTIVVIVMVTKLLKLLRLLRLVRIFRWLVAVGGAGARRAVVDAALYRPTAGGVVRGR